MTAAHSSAPNVPPTADDAFSLMQQLSAEERDRLLWQLQQSLQAEVRAISLQVAEKMRLAGVVITEEEIAAEVAAERRERYAARQQ